MGINLSDADIAKALRDPRAALIALDRMEAENDLAAFVRMAWPIIEPAKKYIHNWHIDAICEHLMAVHRGEIRRLIINVPPGTSKSTLVSVMFPAWEWGPQNMPGMRYIGTSYSERYALRDNAKVRNLVTSDWYQERWGDRFDLIKLGEKKLETSQHGTREAVPFKSLTGGRGDRLLIDDPNSTEGVESDSERLSTERIFLESVPTRLNDPEKSAIIVIQQRLHENDVTGTALSKDLGYVHVSIPMEYDPARHFVTKWFEDPRTKQGELLFPARFPKKVVDEYRVSLAEYGFAGQMQQIPVPRGGAIFKFEWWQLWGNPYDSDDPAFKSFPAFDYVVASLDSAYTEKKENDFSALVVMGVFKDASLVARFDNDEPGAVAGNRLPRSTQASMTEGPKIMLMHAWQVRLPLHELVEKVAATCNRFKVHRLLIENKASGISVGQEIRRLHAGYKWGVQFIDPGMQDKIARAYSVQHIFADRMVYAPDREWADMVQSQMASFPKSSHKDLTDATTQCVRYLRDIGLAIHKHEIEQDLHEQMAYKSAVSKPLYPV